MTKIQINVKKVLLRKQTFLTFVKKVLQKRGFQRAYN